MGQRSQLDLTQLLRSWSEGDRDVLEKLTPLVSVAYSFFPLSSFVRDVDFHFVRRLALGVPHLA
jgi:hypothetical protein